MHPERLSASYERICQMAALDSPYRKSCKGQERSVRVSCWLWTISIGLWSAVIVDIALEVAVGIGEISQGILLGRLRLRVLVVCDRLAHGSGIGSSAVWWGGALEKVTTCHIHHECLIIHRFRPNRTFPVDEEQRRPGRVRRKR